MSVENEVIDRCRTRVGKALGQSWRLDALIGLGGLGAVYAGSHKNGLVAAIKVLHPAIAATPEARAGFPREVVVANRARHPSTVAVLGEEADPQIGAFLVVELLLGETLDARAGGAGGRLPIGQALAIADQVLGALESIHKHGIVHRDLRPRKLFLTNKGALKLLDLGLGALREQVEPRARIARERAAFLSPEQALGRFAEVDARTDVWALGATLFWMLAGTTVFEGETASMLLGSAATRAARSLGRLRPDLPAGLIRLVDSALEREKSRRFASASAMRAELAKVRAELEPPSSRGPVSGPPPTTRRSTLEDLTPSQRGDPPPTARLRGDTPPALRKAAPTLRPPPETASPAAALGMSRAPSTELSSRRAGEAAARPAPPVGAPASADVPPTMPPPPLAKEQPAPPSSRAQVTVASTRGDIVDAEPLSQRGRPAWTPARRDAPTLGPPPPDQEPASQRGWIPEPPSTRGWIPEDVSARRVPAVEPAPPTRRPGASAPVAARAPLPTEPPPSSRTPAPPSTERPPVTGRVLDGEASARASMESLFATKELFSHLQGILTGAVQHGPKHPEVVRYVARTFEVIKAALARFPRGLVFRVTPFAFDAGGRASWEPLAPHDDLPFRLFRSGIRAIGLLPGLDAIELSSLLRILSLEAARTEGAEDDLASLIWEADLPHVAIQRVDVGLEASAETQLQLARERRTLLDNLGLTAESVLAGPKSLQLSVASAGRLRMILKALAIEPAGGEAPDGAGDAARAGAEAELSRGAPALTDRFAVAAAQGFRRAVLRNDGESVARPLRASISSIAEATPMPALQLASRLMLSVDEPAATGAPRLAAELGRSIVAPDALRQILAHLASTPDRADALRRVEGLLDKLDGGCFFAAFEALITTDDADLRALLMPYVARFAEGHEAAIGANLPRVGEALGVELTRILGGIGSVPAREALGNATRSPYAGVRIEALCHAEGLDGDRLGHALDGLLGDPEEAIRIAALEAIARHEIASAEEPLAARAAHEGFDDLSVDERAHTLRALAAVSPARAEQALIAILADSRIIASPPHEQSREICASLLGELASSKEALLALTAASKKRWGNGEGVRAAAAVAMERLCARAARGKEPSR